MKTIKTAVLFVVAIMLLCGTVLFANADSSITSLGVSTEIDGTQVQINNWKKDNTFYLFLPAGADCNNLTIQFEAGADVALDGTTVNNGDTVSLPAQSEHTLTCGEATYTLRVLQSSDIPSLHITTESGSMNAVHASKDHKEAAEIVIIADGEVILEDTLDYIKGRGNSTWGYPKKPYNIKFESKTDLFEMGKAKKWSLLANYNDESVLRNHVALNLAEDANIAFTSKHVYVDLFVNNEYYGNYTLTESVEVGSTRVDISDLEGDTEDANDADLDSYPAGGDQATTAAKLAANTQKWVNIPNNPDDISGGYLLEYDLPERYIKEASGFVTNRNQPIVLKAPEYASEAQVKYVSALYQEFEDAVYSATGYNAKGKHYTEYIDVASFVKMYVFQEYVKNLDAGLTSFYIYKDAGSDIFVAAPVWDFDFALGNEYSVYGTNLNKPAGWWAGVLYHRSTTAVQYLPTILNALYRQDDFFALATAEWKNVFAPILTDAYIADIDAFADTMTDAAIMNAVRWNIFNTNTYSATKSKYTSYVDNSLIKFMRDRRSFLNKGFSDTSVRVFYNANGGTGAMFNDSAVKVGETLTLPSCNFSNGTLFFDGWNTAADGSGTAYSAGASVTLTSTEITFYAQWKDLLPDELNFLEKIIAFFNDLFTRIRNFFESIFA